MCSDFLMQGAFGAAALLSVEARLLLMLASIAAATLQRPIRSIRIPIRIRFQLEGAKQGSRSNQPQRPI